MTVDNLPNSFRYTANGNVVAWLDRGDALGRLVNFCRGHAAD